jgi:hypothetical protein
MTLLCCHDCRPTFAVVTIMNAPIVLDASDTNNEPLAEFM